MVLSSLLESLISWQYIHFFNLKSWCKNAVLQCLKVMNQILQYRDWKTCSLFFLLPFHPLFFLRKHHILESCSKTMKVSYIFFSLLWRIVSYLTKSPRGQGSKETPNIVAVRIALLGLLMDCQVVREKLRVWSLTLLEWKKLSLALSI